MDHVRGAPRYAGGAIVLHWLTAAAFAFQVGLGWRMGVSRGPDTFSAFQLHKSIGITILLLTIARIGWRLAYTPPPSAALRPIERHLAKAIHRGFYGLLLALPLSGWLIVSSGKVAVPTLLYTIVPWPHVPGISGLSSAVRNAINAAASAAHVVMVWIALLAIALHVAGALKHQFADRTTDLARMVPVSPRLLGSAAIAIVVAFAGLMLWGRGGYPAEAPHDVTAPSPAVPTPTPPPGALASAAVPRPLPSETPVKQATMPGIAKPADWAVRMKASSIRFRTSWSQAPVEGGFDAWHAKIRFDPDALATSSAAITVYMASVTASVSSQQAALPGDDWFAAATHPTAVWRATRFRHLGGDRYKADGTLTLRGVSRPLPLGFTLTIAGDVAKMTGAVTIDRTVFGVGQGEWSATTDIPAAVAVRIAITADRVAGTP
ncbi:YceI family protein [Sphingomonas sp. CFBP 8760]|uniref:YceI family protein n=1 Tax=Sphingomonas sp. CFBP 8760 TaxID=2775282 RepID=UPI00178266FB|nr:YceI family protein [Sphingomonas sp. CFBP 8760]MBD8545150.1 YceI family protein [Sphingomonas sp. CFBP 8760]